MVTDGRVPLTFASEEFQGCRFIPYTFSETKPQMVPMDLNFGFQGLALIPYRNSGLVIKIYHTGSMGLAYLPTFSCFCLWYIWVNIPYVDPIDKS